MTRFNFQQEYWDRHISYSSSSFYRHQTSVIWCYFNLTWRRLYIRRQVTYEIKFECILTTLVFTLLFRKDPKQQLRAVSWPMNNDDMYFVSMIHTLFVFVMKCNTAVCSVQIRHLLLRCLLVSSKTVCVMYAFWKIRDYHLLTVILFFNPLMSFKSCMLIWGIRRIRKKNKYNAGVLVGFRQFKQQWFLFPVIL